MGHESNKKLISNALFNLKGRVALVTGGASGIGLMAAQALAVNGAKVYIVGRTEEKLTRVTDIYGKDDVTDGQIIPIKADITNKEVIQRLYDEISSKEKVLDVLVNNAGIAGETFQQEAKTPEEFKQNVFDAEAATFEDWESVYRTNVASTFFMTSAFLPLLQKSTENVGGYSGTVINIASVSGTLKNPQHHFQYNSSKAAAIHLTRMLANVVASNGFKVRINSISPGPFPSEMTTGESGEDQKSKIDSDKYENLPARRPGNDEDFARALIFFVVEQYVNGQNLVLDGGYSLSDGY